MGIIDRLRIFWAGIRGREPEQFEESAPAAPVEEGMDGFGDALDASLGDAVDMAMAGDSRNATPAESTGDGGPEELFASIAATYCQPVKDFVYELKQGTARHEWIEMCMPVMGSIIHGAESLELHAVAQRMIEFRDAMIDVESADRGIVFDEASRALILKRYDALVDALPMTFDTDSEERRDSIIIHSLLRQVPDVGRVTLEKLYAAGLTSIATLYLANPFDMTAATGVPPWLCERICERVSDYREQVADGDADGAVPDGRVKLRQLLTELQRHQAELRHISGAARAATDSGGAKRDCMRRRQTCALQIELHLAHEGEVEFVEELRKLGIERRIERLEQYLEITPTVAVTPVAESSHATEVE